MVYRRSNNSCLHIAVAEHPPQLRVNIRTPVPSSAGCVSLPGSPLASADVGPACNSHLSVPPTPTSMTYASTPSTSSASTRTSPEATSVAIPSRKQKRVQRSVPYARPSALGSPMGSTDTLALENARKGVLQFVKDHPHVIEPCIGDPAAMAITGSNPKLGTPGKSLYTLFFFSSRSVKRKFTCYDCGHVDARFSRALRHQRQDHFGHYPFPCQGGAGHPAW
jgi:hypothetical protein